MIKRPTHSRTRPITKSMFEDAVTIVRVDTVRNRHGETTTNETMRDSKCSTNPISADDERLGDLQKSGVRLTGLREFFTTEPMNVDSKDEFIWDDGKPAPHGGPKRYVSVQTADWGYFQATIAALKEEQ